MQTYFHSALSRLFSDLIKADTVIDVDELEKYASFCSRYGITKRAEQDAANISLAEAISKVSNWSQTKLQVFLKDCLNLSVSDSYCAYPEALLILAYQMCLNSETASAAELISIPTPNVCIDNHQVLYLESVFDDAINSQIQQSYRSISNELRLAGFYFVYIPQIASHYLHYNEDTFMKVVSFLSPQLSDMKAKIMVDKLSHITTASFCNDQLYHQLGMKVLKDVVPSLLIKISDNYVNYQLYTNFLRISIQGDVLNCVKQMVDYFKKMLSSDTIVIPSIEDVGERFLYQGFYKQLLDMYSIQYGVDSSILVDFDEGELQLPEAGTCIKGLRRKEKAFYILLLAKSKECGLNFNSPQSAEQLVEYNNRMKTIQRDYAHIYSLLGGNKTSAPQVDNPDIRRPIVSNIRRCVASLSPILHNIYDFTIHKDTAGTYSVLLSSDKIQLKIKSEIVGVDCIL